MTYAPVALYGFEESIDSARRLAKALELPFREVCQHSFPDGESLVRIGSSADTAVIYRSMDHPNDKLVELMLAASVIRETGATRIILVAPYLCYMRQDAAFRPGEPISQKVIGRFLDEIVDDIVTVDPHLHRTRQISEVFPTAGSVSLSAAPLFVDQLRTDGVAADTVLVGPDSESQQWVEAVARPLGLDMLLGEKTRQSDTGVTIRIPRIERAKGRPIVLVDDLVSTGVTLMQCAKQLAQAGAAGIEALAVHALCGPKEDVALRASGIARLRSTDSIPNPSNAIRLTPLLAESLKEMIS
jgi:ribose-phosphate pyrophosphokinase